MEFIKTIREKQLAAKEAEIQQQATNLITVADFDKQLYIAYSGTPIFPISPEWTSKEILDELFKLRQNYIIAKKFQLNIRNIAAVL